MSNTEYKAAIYMDMDGVLVDFLRGWLASYSGLGEPTRQPTRWDFYKELGYTEEGFNNTLNQLTSHWWATLEPTASFDRLYEQLRDLRELGYIVHILSHAVTPEAKLGKYEWIQRNMPDFLDSLIMVDEAADKAAYAHKRAILVDDNEDNVTRFMEAGGEAMLFGQPWNNYGYGSAEIINCWAVDSTSPEISQWVKIALGNPVYLEPTLDMKAIIDIVDYQAEVDSYGFPLDGENSCFEMPTIELEIPEVAPAGVLDYSTMNDKEYRKNTPLCSGVLYYFPDALELVAQNSMVGWVQHCDTSKPMYWDRSKSADEPDALVRHLVDHHKNPIDDDGTLHLSKVAWRALAMLQKFLEQNPDWRKRNGN
jgi:phosphoglycolate phosphatase-like HAD superfamily hydrolase